MKKRKVIALTIAMVMVLCSFSTAFASVVIGTSEQSEQSRFPDTANHWAKAAIEKWADLGVLRGDDRGFRPDDSITRAEMAVVLDNMMDYQVAAKNTFKDVQAGAWYEDAVLKANAAGILKGDGAGYANPTAKITKEQAALMLARAFAVAGNGGSKTKFTDAAAISSWAKELVFGMEAAGYINGFDGKYNPQDSIKRAEVVTIINNAVKAYYHTAGTYTDNVDGLAIIKVKDVILKGNTINGNLIVAEGVGEGDATLDSVTVKGSTVVRGGGEKSIHITGKSSIDSIRVEKVNDKVRVVISDGITVKAVEVAAGEEIIITGQVGTLELLADNVKVYATAAEVKTAAVTGVNSTLIVSKDSKIDEITATAKVSVSGEGTVAKVTLKEGANNSSITTAKTTINVAEGVTGTKGTGGTAIAAGSTATNGATADAPAKVEAPAAGGGVGGGGGSVDTPKTPTMSIEGVTPGEVFVISKTATAENTAIDVTVENVVEINYTATLTIQNDRSKEKVGYASAEISGIYLKVLNTYGAVSMDDTAKILGKLGSSRTGWYLDSAGKKHEKSNQDATEEVFVDAINAMFELMVPGEIYNITITLKPDGGSAATLAFKMMKEI